MADFAKCIRTKATCPSANHCYRTLAPSSPWQTMFCPEEIGEEGKCGFYIDGAEAIVALARSMVELSNT